MVNSTSLKKKKVVSNENIKKPDIQPSNNLEKNDFNQEEVISGENARKFYELLMKPPKDPKKVVFIKGALTKFPNPSEPTELDIDL